MALFSMHHTPRRSIRHERTGHILFADGRLLRTHTSTVQIRTMQAAPPPIRVIAPGAAYVAMKSMRPIVRSFTNRRPLCRENVSVADLKGTLEFFMRELFGAETEFQFRRITFRSPNPVLRF